MENLLQITAAKAVRVAHSGLATNHSNHTDGWVPPNLGTTHTYAQGTPLFLQGTPARDIFLIELGLIKLLHLDEDGEEFIIGLRSIGAMIGAASVIVQEPFPFSAITTTPCRLRRIPADRFLHLAKNDLQFCWNLHQVLGREVQQQANQLFAFKNLSARQRFENLLFQFVSTMKAQAGRSREVRLPLKHWEIAQLIGVTPEHLSRVIKQLQREAILRKENGCLVIADVTRLYHDADLSYAVDASQTQTLTI